MIQLIVQVVSGTGDCAQWIEKYRDQYLRKTGLRLYPGTLNVRLQQPFRMPPSVVRLEASELGGRVSVNILHCRVFQLPSLILRTDANERGDGDHPRTIIEIASDVRLRDAYNLSDGDEVVVEIDA
jgi:riboflavin kinase